MSALELYAKQAQEKRGYEHMQAIKSLRSYMNLTSEEELIRYINMITDMDTLRTLTEAGMRGNTHKALISRMNLLIKEQTGGV
jgi:hypothetical protein